MFIIFWVNNGFLCNHKLKAVKFDYIKFYLYDITLISNI